MRVTHQRFNLQDFHIPTLFVQGSYEGDKGCNEVQAANIEGYAQEEDVDREGVAAVRTRCLRGQEGQVRPASV